MLTFTLSLKLSRLLLILLFARFFQPQPELVVTLRDAQDRPLTGITVQVSGTAGGPPLATATTDTQGRATLSGLAAEQVRVLVRGQLPDGTPLVLPGQDAAGITVLLGPPPTRLDLRVTPDGTVLPDPAVMAETTTTTAAPTALADQPTPFPSASVPPSAQAAEHAAQPAHPLTPSTLPTGAANAAPTLPAPAGWLRWELVVGALLGAGLLVLLLRWRRS